MLGMQQDLVYYHHIVVPDITYKNIGALESQRTRGSYSTFVIPRSEQLLNEHLVPSRIVSKSLKSSHSLI